MNDIGKSNIQPNDPVIGKLFPLWVVQTFKDLIMGEEEVKKGEDPCKVIPSQKKILRPYQVFLSRYLSQPQFQGILVYHGLGSGKSAAGINLISVLNHSTTAYNVIILLPASLQSSWRNEMKYWMGEMYAKYESTIYFVSTNASNLEKQFFDVIRKADTTNNNIYMIDECHNFFSNVHSNILSGNQKRRASTVYDYIQNDLQQNPFAKCVLLSGTPIRSEVYELALIFNLLRPGTFPKDEATFHNMFLLQRSEEDIPSLDPKRKILFQRRISGLVSYFRGSSPLLYARREVHFLNLNMEPRQEDVYSHFRNIEKKAEAMAIRSRRKSSQGFRTSSRMSGNFVSPVNGLKRPRPAQYRLSTKDEERLISGKEIADDRLKAAKEYMAACQQFFKSAEAYFMKFSTDGLKKDMEAWKKKGNYTKAGFDAFRKQEGLSPLFQEMLFCSVKIVAALLLASSSPGPTVIYSQFVVMEGLEAVKLYLRLGGLSFVEFHGGIEKEQRQKNLEAFNSGKINVMLLSAAGSEGLSLKNVRTVVVLEPAWSESTIEQVIGRAIRQCSHRDLPMEDRNVQIYRLKALESEGFSTDEHVEDQALRRQAQKQSFLDALKTAAVDCHLFAAQNKVGPCFQFPALEMTKERPGPAFHKDLEKDMEKNDNYKVKKLKVRKIKGVLSVNDSPEPFLLDEETGVVYDAVTTLPIGRVKRTNEGFFEKVDADTYLVTKIF